MDGWDFIFPNIWDDVIRTLALGSIIFTCHDHDGLMSMFVLVCLLTDTQSHGTSIAVWGETAIMGFVLLASKAHCLEMWVSSLICVSAHMPLLDSSFGSWWWCWKRLKTNPSHRDKEKKVVRGGQWERSGVGGHGRRHRKQNGATVLHCFKGLVIMMGCCQAPCLNNHGGNQSHAKLIYGHGRGENGPPSSCTGGLLLIRDTRMLISGPAAPALLTDISLINESGYDQENKTPFVEGIEVVFSFCP